LESHSIDIDVDSAGNAQVVERFFLFFQNEQQLVDFRQTVNEVGVSLSGWKSYDPRIYPHIGQEQDVEVQGISFIENPNAIDFLEISYGLNSPIMEKKGETSRVVSYSVKPKFFAEFSDGALWVIPEGTTITVRLPKGVRIEGEIKPDAVVTGSDVTWTGYVSGNELNIDYGFFKEIASFDLREAVQQLLQSDIFWFLVAFVAVFFLLLFAKRKSIGDRVENYLVAHSDFESFGE